MTDTGDDDAAWAPPAPAPAAPTAAAELLPGYRDAEQIARGGDSVVYRAHQESVGRDVAIKVVLLDDPESIARFRRELDITVRLGRQHPHIMTVLAVGTTRDGQPCLVMDHFELGSLHDRVRDRGPLPVAEAVAAGSVVADALAFAHAQGVLHRDVKPQNVLVLPTSYVLADFGLARAIDAGHSSSLERFSYRHASPQILDGEPPTVADDVYSLGSTLFTLLDGRPPFAADDPDEDSALSYLRRARSEAPRPLTRPDVPPALRAIVTRCLAKRREDRFPGAAELRDALDAVPTESRNWAPDAPAAAPASVVTPVVPPPVHEPTSGDAAFAPPANHPPSSPPEPSPPEPSPPEPSPPPVAAPVAPPVAPVASWPPAAPVLLPAVPVPSPTAPEPVAVSALAHLGEAASVNGDGDATGLRPAEPPPPVAPPRPSRWLPIVIGVAVALVIGVAFGLLRGGGGRDDAAASPTPSGSPSQGVFAIPTFSGNPSSVTGKPVVDPKIAPADVRAKRTGTRVELKWTDPTRGTVPFVVYLVDNGRQQIGPGVEPGSSGVTLTDFPSGPHCLQVTAVTTAGGQAVFGPSKRTCLK